MKVTRFVNGSKITKPIDSETIIKSDVISNTINHVNLRLKTSAETLQNMKKAQYE